MWTRLYFHDLLNNTLNFHNSLDLNFNNSIDIDGNLNQFLLRNEPFDWHFHYFLDFSYNLNNFQIALQSLPFSQMLSHCLILPYKLFGKLLDQSLNDEIVNNCVVAST